jgi:DNA-directed RNA polymerase specialized sigma24 family protein
VSDCTRLGVRTLPSTTTPDGEPAFQRELLAIRADPKVRNLAWRHAGDRDLAEDALQEACWAVSRVKDPQHIEDLRAYFCKVLIRAAHRLGSQLGATPVEDLESLSGIRRPGLAAYGKTTSRLPDEAACARLQAETWLKRFDAQRDCLRAAVPVRSSDPERYRDLIVVVAEQVLHDGIDGATSEADSHQALRATYPEWFDQPGCAANTGHQRFCRARADVRDLLKAVIDRDELR